MPRQISWRRRRKIPTPPPFLPVLHPLPDYISHEPHHAKMKTMHYYQSIEDYIGRGHRHRQHQHADSEAYSRPTLQPIRVLWQGPAAPLDLHMVPVPTVPEQGHLSTQGWYYHQRRAGPGLCHHNHRPIGKARLQDMGQHHLSLFMDEEYGV
jgi:hypothetical protein